MSAPAALWQNIHMHLNKPPVNQKKPGDDKILWNHIYSAGDATKGSILPPIFPRQMIVQIHQSTFF
ncbi:hypothetical protein DSUL_90100 [Desulfovibrionales bacterium]